MKLRAGAGLTATTYTGKVVRTLQVSDGTPPLVASHAYPTAGPHTSPPFSST